MTPFTSLNENDYKNIFENYETGVTLTTDYTTLTESNANGMFYTAYMFATAGDYIRITLDNITYQFETPGSYSGGIIQASDIAYNSGIKLKSSGGSYAVSTGTVYSNIIFSGIKYQHLKIETKGNAVGAITYYNYRTQT